MVKNIIKMYTDGGSRGNPGNAAIGIVIYYDNNKKTYAEYIGKTTNNIAEYKAVIFGLKKIKQLIGKEQSLQTNIECFSDSELLVNQLNGKYKIKDDDIKNLFIEIWNLKQDFNQVSFHYISRENNKESDFLVNKALDQNLF
ncbi:MAG: ribonuclease HI family protein [Minisyncoccia bacterium]